MKRNMIVAAVAATAVIGGGAVAGAALTGGNERSGHADELSASVTGWEGGTPSSPQPLDGSDDRDDASADDASNGDDTSGGTARSGGARDTAGSGSGGWIGVAGKVERTALAAAPGYVVDIERDDDDDDDGRHWEVDVAGDDGRLHELRISLDGTEVLGHERDDDDDDVREKRRLLSNASVLAGDAARIAEEYSGASVKELELEKDEKAWDLELRDPNGSEWELKVSVDSGEVFDVERDD
ncbi:PepSY domain-containing protein [Streptomyces alkaliphilus]|uniref:PepSY domain-containing protein n=1 Tax=Streptomyces alkaliphilus TaxID=1472722 RepID=UPI001180D9DE|nr:PepSY domain-containing protein [Streptomyces alkaliphilus]MQS08795.1 hypothetical protein [Streptomyces alkaliphilus]